MRDPNGYNKEAYGEIMDLLFDEAMIYLEGKDLGMDFTVWLVKRAVKSGGAQTMSNLYIFLRDRKVTRANRKSDGNPFTHLDKN